MNKDITEKIKIAVNADVVYSASKCSGEKEFDFTDVNYCSDIDINKEHYKSCSVIKLLSADEIPNDVMKLFEGAVDDRARFDNMIAAGEKFMYTEDAVGGISYDFVFYKKGEYYK